MRNKLRWFAVDVCTVYKQRVKVLSPSTQRILVAQLFTRRASIQLSLARPRGSLTTTLTRILRLLVRASSHM